jgi:XXXCH domain-containing protein
MGSDVKFSEVLTAKELAVYLQSFADNFNCKLTEPIEFDLNEFKEIKLAIKPVEDKFELKVKMKTQSPEKSSVKKGHEKYSTLKKRMKNDFETIVEVTKNNVLPLEKVFNKFLVDSEKMMTYPRKGDAMGFEAYTKALNELKAAFENKDLQAFKESCKRIDALKKSCHKMYK